MSNFSQLGVFSAEHQDSGKSGSFRERVITLRIVDYSLCRSSATDRFVNVSTYRYAFLIQYWGPVESNQHVEKLDKGIHSSGALDCIRVNEQTNEYLVELLV